MQDSLRWRCLWWVCLAAAASVSTKGVARTAEEVQDLEQCTVLDFTLEPSFYTLPNNLTVKPLSEWWHLKFQLSMNQSMHIACIRLEDRKSHIKLSMFSGDCKNGKNVDFGYLTSPMKLETWTTLGLRIIRDTVLVEEPQGGLVNLTGDGFTLPQNGLWMTVTQAWGVETAVGCAVSCPVHYHNSAGTDIKNLVGEWQQESLYFHFRPRPSFKRLHYEVKCRTRQNKVFRHEVEIKPGEEDAAKNWRLVELRQRQSNATVRLNGKLLEAIQLPESCISSMHIIWIVGPGFFGFNCTPSGAKQTTKEKQTDETQPGAIMHPGAIVGITVFVTLVVQGVGLLVRHFIKKKSEITISRPASPHSAEDPQPLPRPASSHSEIETTPIPKPTPQHTEGETTSLPKPAQTHAEGGTTPLAQPAPQHTEGETTALPKPAQTHAEGETTPLSKPAPQHTEEGTTPLPKPAPQHTEEETTPLPKPAPQHTEEETTPLPKPAPQHTERRTTPLPKPAPQHTEEETTPILKPAPQHTKGETTPLLKPAPTHAEGETTPLLNPVPTHTEGETTPVLKPAPQHTEEETTPLLKPAPQHTEEETTPLPKPAPQHTHGETTPLPKPPPQHTEEETTPLPKPTPQHTQGETTPLPKPAPQHTEEETTPLPKPTPQHTQGETTPFPKPAPTHAEGETTPLHKPALRYSFRKLVRRHPQEGTETRHEPAQQFKEEKRNRRKSLPSTIKAETCYNNPLDPREEICNNKPVSLNTSGETTTNQRSLSFSFHNGVEMMKHAEGETAPLPKPEPKHTERETTPLSKPAPRNTLRKFAQRHTQEGTETHHEPAQQFKEEKRYRHISVPSTIKAEICNNKPVSLKTRGETTTSPRSPSFSFYNGMEMMKKLPQKKNNSEYDDLLLEGEDDD